MDPVETPTAEDAAQPDAQSTPPLATPPAAGPMAGAPAAAAPSQPAPAAPSPAAQVVAHQSRLGQIAMAAMGKQVSYQADPQTGVVTPVVQQRSFSDFARNLVGGLLLGGAIGAKAGAEAGGSPLAAGVAGAQGVNAQAQQQDDKARAQAEQSMKDQQDASAENDQAALRKAQIAHANLTTLQLNQAIQKQGYEDHDKLAQAGKANVKPYVDAGLKPIFEDIPESQMEQTIKNYPGASALDWTHTGMITGADLSKATGMDVEQTGEHPVEGPDGQTHYEATFTAFDPKGEVPLSGATLDQWKQDGFLKSLGANAQNVLKPDMQMPAEHYIALKNQHEKFQLQTEQTRQHNVKVQADADAHEKEVVDARNKLAEANKYNAEAVKASAEAGKAREEIKAMNGQAGPDVIDALAQSYLAGTDTRDTIAKGMGGAKIWNAVQARIKQINPTFDVAKNEKDYKIYNTAPVQSKVNAAQTLVGEDGTSGILGQLNTAAKEAGLTSLPSLNNVQAWTRLQSGSSKGVAIHQLAIDAAEQYGSIFANGGETSDAKIRLGQELFDSTFNQQQTGVATKTARKAINERLRSMASNNFIRREYGHMIYEPVVNENGQSGSIPADKLNDWLAANPKRQKAQ